MRIVKKFRKCMPKKHNKYEPNMGAPWEKFFRWGMLKKIMDVYLMLDLSFNHISIKLMMGVVPSKYYKGNNYAAIGTPI